MTIIGPAGPPGAGSPLGGLPDGDPQDRAADIARLIVREPFTRRARYGFLYCLAGVGLGPAGFAVTVVLLVPGAVVSASVAGTFIGLLLVILAIRFARWAGSLHRGLAARLLGERIAAPPPFRPGRGILGRLDARLRDGPGWRAVAYALVKLPVAVAQGYVVVLWVYGLYDLGSPLWWLFRSHAAGVPPSAAPVTPLPFGSLSIFSFTWIGTFRVAVAGAVLVVAASWLTRAVVTADRRLIRSLLGPGDLAERVRYLEETRARAVEDSAALLRQVERDLHDGAQARLAAIAMNLGMVREKLGAGGDPPDIQRARELAGAAHDGAKEALVELRKLVRGIHPPVLDKGLADAIATLAAGSAIPVEVTAGLPERPTPAIETIAYFCAAELLANAAKHSSASTIRIVVDSGDAERGRVLRMLVSDDGLGGADPGRGSGLAGLAQRVGTVDGRLEIASPPGGPTRITVTLPLRA